ncbi:MAG: hypothetical protein HWE16_06595 [Gammaproteobacteria bacterium]|nr:hypothetical protein [Gammaproteobacteria bacterium]
MKSIIAAILGLCCVAVAATPATFFEIKIYDISGIDLNTAINSRKNTDPLYNPKLLVEAGKSGSLEVSEEDNKLLQVEFNDIDENLYEYQISLFKDGEKVSNMDTVKKFKKEHELMLITDVEDRKYLVEVFARNQLLEINKDQQANGKKEQGMVAGCGYVSVRKEKYARYHYPAVIREIDGDLKNAANGEFKVSSGMHEILIYAAVPESLSKRESRQNRKGALTKFKVLPNKIYYIGAYYNKTELDKKGEYLWKPVVIDVQDKECS